MTFIIDNKGEMIKDGELMDLWPLLYGKGGFRGWAKSSI